MTAMEPDNYLNSQVENLLCIDIDDPPPLTTEYIYALPFEYLFARAISSNAYAKHNELQDYSLELLECFKFYYHHPDSKNIRSEYLKGIGEYISIFSQEEVASIEYLEASQKFSNYFKVYHEVTRLKNSIKDINDSLSEKEYMIWLKGQYEQRKSEFIVLAQSRSDGSKLKIAKRLLNILRESLQKSTYTANNPKKVRNFGYKYEKKTLEGLYELLASHDQPNWIDSIKTTKEFFVNVLSEDWDENDCKIYWQGEASQVRLVIDLIETLFKNLSIASIGRSSKFISKEGSLLSESFLNKAKSALKGMSPKQRDIIEPEILSWIKKVDPSIK